MQLKQQLGSNDVKHLQKHPREQHNLQPPPETPKPTWNITESRQFLAGCVVWEKCSRNTVLTSVALLYTCSCTRGVERDERSGAHQEYQKSKFSN